MKQCGLQSSASATTVGVRALPIRTRVRHRVPELLFSFAILAAGSTGAAQAAARIAFTSSATGNGNLSSWPDAAGSNTFGLDAADAICQARAQAAGLPEPPQFVAWLSDRDNDAYCRLLGLGGKRADNCGATLPLPDAGPWVRTDGLAFADSLAALISGRLLSPLMMDEHGERIAALHESITATKADGTMNSLPDVFGDCNRWTTGLDDPDPETSVALGASNGTTEAWTDSGLGASCSGTAHLVCMQKGVGSPAPPRSLNGRHRAFVTDTNVTGNLGGLAGADALCRTSAEKANLPDAGVFKALMASSNGAVQVKDRFPASGPWYRQDGMLFASSIAQITAGEVTTPLNVTETGAYVGYAHAFTGAEGNGTPSTNDCSGWTSSVGLGDGSLINWTFFGPTWLSTSQFGCNAVLEPNAPAKKMYCLADVYTFRDEFEQ